MKRIAGVAAFLLLASALSGTSAQDKGPQNAQGAGVSGTNATGITDKGSAGAQYDQAISQPNAKPPVGPSPAPRSGDAKAGADVATRGAPDKGAPPCGSCHGANGEGNLATGFPRLAGLPEQYLSKQLDDYADGSRAHPMMSPIAKALDAAQRRDVSAYFAGVKPAAATTAAASAPPPKGPQAPDLDRARTLARLGDEQLHVQACANCHGPEGAGLPPSYPALAGQPQAYLASVLNEWRNGNRHNDPSGQMPMIAKALGEADIASLAALFGAMPPPDAAATVAHTQ
jgi:cytochrome c553